MRLVDPIRVGGTLSQPRITVAEDGRESKGGIVGAIGRSIGSALGLRKDQPAPPAIPPVDCERLVAGALR
ncbi:hypothetical protein [Sandaracinobacteroides hominis]|uniref:hypothetical protein n=1 Tax=Sandaracinobacteroides hominis TaxID=2780086 RepID=UPI0018F4CB3B|nr:hypothetical protein [Sandaracinobacteroides hominis]